MPKFRLLVDVDSVVDVTLRASKKVISDSNL